MARKEQVERTPEGFCTSCLCKPAEEGRKRCLSCYNSYKRWQNKNKDKIKAAKERFKKNNPHSERDRKRKLRIDVLIAYGGTCECCGETEPIFLAIDHIDGIKQEPYEKRLRGDALYAWLKREGYPKDGYRILCNNCNWAVRFGPCPHQKDIT